MNSSPSAPLVSPSGTNAGGRDDDASPARPTSAQDVDNENDDALSKPPFLENIDDDDDDDGASTSSSAVSTSTMITEAAGASEPPPPPIMRLPEEMLSCIFAFLPPAAVGRACCVCSSWREAATGYDAAIWREALSKALGSLAAAEAARRALMLQLQAVPSSSAPLTSPSSAAAEKQQGEEEEEGPARQPLPLSIPSLPTWRRTFLATPAPRCDGIYVSRESYIRTGLTEWTVRNPVHVVVYFRYYRFFPPEQAGEEGEEAAAAATTDAPTSAASASAAPPPPNPRSPLLKPPRGRFWYRTTPDPPAKAARSLALGPPRASSSSGAAAAASEKSTVVEGRYRLGGGGSSGSMGKRGDPSVLRTAWRVRNSAGTEVRAKLRLRSSEGRQGAWDRMDVLALASHDLASGLTLPFNSQQGRNEEEDDVGRGGFPSATVRRGRQQPPPPPRAPPPLTHKRGLSTFVFIPWGGVEDTPLNLPLSQMDCWIPG